MKKPNEYKIQNRKDNRWYVQVRHQGHTYCIYGKTKKAAREKLVCKIRQLQEATLNGIDIISAEMKLKDWAALCVETYSKQNVIDKSTTSYIHMGLNDDFKEWLDDEWFGIPEILTIADVSRITGYATTTVQRWTATKKAEVRVDRR